MKLYKIVCFAILISGSVLRAQDIHFSQYNQAPLALNPALTGLNACDWRVTLNYRNQWATVTIPYVTYAASVDLPLIKEIGGADKLAGGLFVFNDVSGDGELTNLSALASLAYLKGLGGGDDQVLSLGVQGGLMQKSINWGMLRWADQWDGNEFNQDVTSIESFLFEDDNVSSFDVNAGLAYYGKFSETFNLQGGVGFFHLTTPYESFYNQDLLPSDAQDNALGMRIAAHAKAAITLNRVIGIMPSVMFQTQTGAKEILAGVDLGYFIDNANFPATLFFGAHYRVNDAIIPVIGIDYKNFRVGASYDVNTSDLKDASSGKGGLELSLSYTGCIIPVIPKQYVMPCPRY